MNLSSRSIDVVIPCYNYARFLERSVNSVLNQERVDVRVLIIDDTSTDDTPAVGVRLARDPRVEFRRHAKNMRHIATYNEGLIGWAAANYSLLLSADDWLAPGALARAVDLLESRPEVGFSCGYALIVKDDEAAAAPPPLDGKWCVLGGDEFTEHCVRLANPVSTPTAVVRTRLQQEIGGYEPTLPHSGDMQMWLRFAARAPVGIIRDVQAFYRWHGQNMGRDYYSGVLGDLREQEAACAGPLSEWSAALQQNWLRILRKRLGDAAFWAAHKAFEAGDIDGLNTCLQYALERDYTLPGSRRLRTLQAKRLLGHRLWNRLKPVVDRFRGIQAATPQSEHFSVGKLTGWGPREERFWQAPAAQAQT